jgi:hypothetical protein
MIKIISHILCILLVCVSTSTYAIAEEPYDSVLIYLIASKNGDVDTMLSLIDGPYLRRSRNLLENNTNYPEFLRDYYTEATFRIVDFSIMSIASLKESHSEYYQRIVERYKRSNIEINAIKDQLVQVVHSEVTFASGQTLPIRFLLEKDGSGIWKIVEKSLVQ